MSSDDRPEAADGTAGADAVEAGASIAPRTPSARAKPKRRASSPAAVDPPRETTGPIAVVDAEPDAAAAATPQPDPPEAIEPVEAVVPVPTGDERMGSVRPNRPPSGGKARRPRRPSIDPGLRVPDDTDGLVRADTYDAPADPPGVVEEVGADTERDAGGLGRWLRGVKDSLVTTKSTTDPVANGAPAHPLPPAEDVAAAGHAETAGDVAAAGLHTESRPARVPARTRRPREQATDANPSAMPAAPAFGPLGPASPTARVARTVDGPSPARRVPRPVHRPGPDVEREGYRLDPRGRTVEEPLAFGGAARYVDVAPPTDDFFDDVHAPPVSPAGPPPRAVRVTAAAASRRRPRVRRVTRVVRHVDPWSVFKVSICFSLVLYVVCLTAGVLLWNVAYTTGTVDNVERFFESFGWESFDFKGGELYHHAWIAGLFAALGLTGMMVLAATLFNLITDLVGGVRVSVLEEEVIERDPLVRRIVVPRNPTVTPHATTDRYDPTAPVDDTGTYAALTNLGPTAPPFSPAVPAPTRSASVPATGAGELPPGPR